MKSLIAISLALLLSGCMYQHVDGFDIDRAIKVCAKTDAKIQYITEHFQATTEVRCNDNSHHNLDKREN